MVRFFRLLSAARGTLGFSGWLVSPSFPAFPLPQAAHSQEAQNGTLHGTVINSITDEPIGSRWCSLPMTVIVPIGKSRSTMRISALPNVCSN